MTLTKVSYSMISSAPKSVLDFGAVGDGVTDDTAALQAALTSGQSIVGVPGATYLISASLTMAVDGTQFDGQGCSFKVSSGTLTGTLYQGQFFILQANRLVLRNFVIPYSALAHFDTAIDGQGMPVNRTAIAIGAANDCVIDSIRIENSRAGATSTWNGGIRMTGGNADNNTISNNVLIQTSLGINYCPDSYAGNGNKVLNNRLEDCFYGIYAGDPTVSNASVGNVVQGNYMSWPTYSAYMGVEDYSGGTNNVIGTQIVGNTFVGSAASTPSYYAISAVSANAVVENNFIINWGFSLTGNPAAIEVAADSGTTIANNVIKWTNTPEGVTGTNRCGIICSGDSALGANSYIGNKIENANYGIWIHPDTTGTTDVIQGNSFVGCARAIYADGISSSLSIVSNVVDITRPQTAARNLIDIVYSRAEIIGNIVTFAAASSQNTYATVVIHAAGDNITIANNFGTCGGYSFSAGVEAISTGGATPTNCLATNNTWVDGMGCNYQFFTKIQSFGNVVPAGITGGSNNKLSFYDGQSPIAKPAITGSKGANAALTSLLTQLASLNLITDNTT